MRILQFTASYGQGGLERHVRDLADELACRGHEVLLAGHPSWSREIDERVRTVALDVDRSRWNLPVLWALRRVVTDFGPDVVHAHANKAAVMAARALTGLPVTTVATAHGYKKNNRVFRGYDGVIAVSNGIADHLGYPGVHVVYNGIRPFVAGEPVTDSFSDLHLRPGLPVFLAAGRLAPVKAYDMLIDAWVPLADRATLVIAGDGPEMDRLQQQVARLGLSAAVRLAGYRDDVPALLQACHGLVISSQREGFPYSMVEALLARRPVFSTRVPGAVEWLPARGLSAVGDTDGLSAMLARALDETDAVQRDYLPVWRRAADELTLAGMVDRIEAVYSSLLLPGK